MVYYIKMTSFNCASVASHLTRRPSAKLSKYEICACQASNKEYKIAVSSKVLGYDEERSSGEWQV